VVAPPTGSEHGILLHLRTLVETGQSAAGLLLTLQTPDHQLLAEAGSGQTGSLRLLSIADLLHLRESAGQMSSC